MPRDAEAAREAAWEDSSFTFLSPQEDLELRHAMRRIKGKIEAEAMANAKPIVDPDDKWLEDQLLAYKWYERNFDEAFTREQNLLMEREATLKVCGLLVPSFFFVCRYNRPCSSP